MLDSLKAKHQAVKSALSYQKGVRDNIQQQIETHERRLTTIVQLTDLYNKTSLLLQRVSTFSRESVATIFETMVTEALQSILETNSLQFKVHFVQTKNRVDVHFKLYDTVLQRELDVMKSFGGGVKDIISTILRIMVLELHKPAIHGPIILDEVGRNISKEYQANFGTFLQSFSQKLNRQIILVTHSPIIAQAAEKTIKVTKNAQGHAVVVEE